MSTQTIGGLGVTLGMNHAGFTAGVGTVQQSLGGLVSSFGKLGALVGVTVGIGEGFKKAIGGFAEMESSQVAFETLLGSGDRAKQLMGELSKLGAETPFQLPELTKAGKNLAAFGVDADQITPKLRRIGDISALLNQPIGEMATLFGKAKVAGVLMSEDINQFTERGVPLIGQLAKQFGVAEVQVKKLASEGKISFGDLDKALTSLTDEGGMFAGGMAKQAGTLGGLWSTFTDNIGMSLTKVGEGIVTIFSGKEALSGLISFTGTIQDTIAGWVDSIGQIKPYIDLTFSAIGSIVSTVWEGISLAFQVGMGVIELVFSSFGASAGGVKDLFVDSMLGIRFAFDNFGAFWELGWENMKLGMVLFFHDAIHLFTVNIPEVLSWFSRNWKNVFTDVYNLTTTIFTNIGKNIWNFFKNIPGLVAGTTTFAEIWTPLTDGFKSSITEALTVTKRELTDWEKEQLQKVGELQSKLGTKWEDFYSKEKTKIAGALAGALSAKGPGFWGSLFADAVKGAKSQSSIGGMLAKPAEWKQSGAYEYGSKDAYSLIQNSRNFQGHAQQTAEATKKTASNTQKTADNTQAMAEGINAIVNGATQIAQAVV